MYIKNFFVISFLITFSSYANAIVVNLPLDQINDNASIASEVAILEELSHKAALKFPAVCAVIADDESGDGLTIVTGTYFAKNRGLGFVLTTADVVYKLVAKPQLLFLSFMPRLGDYSNRIAIKKVYIYPDFSSENEDYINDVAIIEFDANLLPREILPVPIDDTESYDEAYFFEGTMLGYGLFGTNKTTLQNLAKIHASKTYMYLDKSVFRTVLPHLFNFDSSAKDPYQFAIEYPSRKNMDIIRHHVKVHSQQGFLGQGDFGGPLLLKSKTYPEKFKLVGIARSSFLFSEQFPVVEELFKSTSMEWEPVFLYKKWIKKIVEGTEITHTDL